MQFPPPLVCGGMCVITHFVSIDNAVLSTVSVCNVYKMVRCIHDHFLHRGPATMQYDSCTADVLQTLVLVTI